MDNNAPITTGLATRLTHWAKKPFTDDMDLTSITLLTIFVVTVAVLWNLTLHKLIESSTS